MSALAPPVAILRMHYKYLPQFWTWKCPKSSFFKTFCGHKLAYSTFQAFLLSLKGYGELSLTQINMQGQSALMQL